MMDATIARPLQALRLQLQAVPERMVFNGNRSAILVSLSHSLTKHGDQGFHVAQVLHKCCYFWSSTTSDGRGELRFELQQMSR